MTPLDTIALWLATYALHSTLLLGSAWLLARLLPAASERLWRFAVLGAVATATLSASGLLAPRSSLSLPGLELRSALPDPAAATPRASDHGVEATRSVDDTALPHSAHPHRSLAGHDPSRREPPPLAAEDGVAASRTTAGPGAAGREPSAVAATDGPLGLGPWHWIAALWSALTAATVVVLGTRSLRYRRRLLAGRHEAFGEARRLLDELERRAGFEREIRLTLCPAARVPMARGFARPEICLPATLEHELVGEELEAALAHELAHLERFDPLWRAVVRAIASVLALQPLNRLACRALEREAEIRCDDRAADLTGRPAALARCLTRVASWTMGERPVALPALGSDDSWLRRRVIRLLDTSPRPRSPRLLQAVAVVPPMVVALFAPGLGAAPATGLAVPAAGAAVLAGWQPVPDRSHPIDTTPLLSGAASDRAGDAPPVVHRLTLPVFATEARWAVAPVVAAAPAPAPRPPAPVAAPAAAPASAPAPALMTSRAPLTAPPAPPAATSKAAEERRALQRREAASARAARARVAETEARVAEARAGGRAEAGTARREARAQAEARAAQEAAAARATEAEAAEAVEQTEDERYHQLERELDRTLDELDQRLESTAEAIEESIEAELELLGEAMESQLEGIERELEGSLEPLEHALDELGRERGRALESGDPRRAEVLERRMRELGSALSELGTRLGTVTSRLVGSLADSAVGSIARSDHQAIVELARAQAEAALRLAHEIQSRRESAEPLDDQEMQALRERMDALARELEPKRRELEQRMRELEVDLEPTRERLLQLRERLERELEQWRERHRELLERVRGDTA